MKHVLPRRVQLYADAIVDACRHEGPGLASVVVFGSVVTGSFAESASDVDMILVLPDSATPEHAAAVRRRVDALEIAHGFRKAPDEPPGGLERLALTITANVRSFFICSRADFLSGDVARLLGISRTQAMFVDRVVIPSIISSGVTVWGEDLLPHVPVQPIRRVDVFKAFFGLYNQIILSAALYPFLPGATGYAMGALKRSIHNCYFCFNLRPAALADEIAFFQQRLGRDATLDELLRLRQNYRPSFSFIVRSIPALARLHLRTATGNSFPRALHEGVPDVDVRQPGKQGS